MKQCVNLLGKWSTPYDIYFRLEDLLNEFGSKKLEKFLALSNSDYPVFIQFELNDGVRYEYVAYFELARISTKLSFQGDARAS